MLVGIILLLVVLCVPPIRYLLFSLIGWGIKMSLLLGVVYFIGIATGKI